MYRRLKPHNKLLFLTALAFAALLGGCSTTSPTIAQRPMPDFYVLFFVPGTSQLDPAAEQVVKQAAFTARTKKPARIEIAVPPDTPGGLKLVEGRMTAIQNILSGEGTDPKLYTRGAVAEQTQPIPAAANRAEIRLVR